jgi:hypothetical protein
MYSLEALQAINDWQISSTPSRTRRLKEVANQLPEGARSCYCMCFRQLDLATMIARADADIAAAERKMDQTGANSPLDQHGATKRKAARA